MNMLDEWLFWKYEEWTMEKIRNLLQKPIATGVIGLIIGLIIGLPILGWGLWPVKWKDADASYLRQDLKAQYLCMIVDSYKVNSDASLAAARLDSLGISTQEASFALDSIQSGGCSYSANDEVLISLKSALAGGVVAAAPATTPESNIFIPTPVSTTSTPAKSGNKLSDVLLLAFLCLLFVGIGVVLYLRFFSSKRNPTEKIPPSGDMHDFDNPLDNADFENDLIQPAKPTASAAAPVSAVASDIPAAHFITTYVIGDDMYDDSFSIDTVKGELLGECGVGISDTIGVGEPRKISAFEVWLFDKNVTQTVTKVLMSSKAMNDPAIHQRLASRGEPVLVEPGEQIILETPSLQLQAKVIEMVYGQGALPQGSYFERLTLELSVWPK
jgi:hypothetical protein